MIVPRIWTRNSAYRKIINSPRWRRLRNAYIVSEPLCERCRADGRTQPADVVHHIKPLEDYLDMPHIMETLAYDPNNLMSLCHTCHGKIHSEILSRSKDAHIARARAKTELFRQRFLERPT